MAQDCPAASTEQWSRFLQCCEAFTLLLQPSQMQVLLLTLQCSRSYCPFAALSVLRVKCEPPPVPFLSLEHCMCTAAAHFAQMISAGCLGGEVLNYSMAFWQV